MLFSTEERETRKSSNVGLTGSVMDDPACIIPRPSTSIPEGNVVGAGGGSWGTVFGTRSMGQGRPCRRLQRTSKRLEIVLWNSWMDRKRDNPVHCGPSTEHNWGKLSAIKDPVCCGQLVHEVLVLVP
jgi:hypothetical protein